MRKWQEFVGANFIKKTDAPASVEEEIALGAPPAIDDDADLQTFKL